MATINGTNGDDTITGTSTDDVINGREGDDVLLGLEGEDELYGDEDDDTLIGGEDADILNGGKGTDTASYYYATAGVRAYLSTGAGTGGEAAGDTFIDIENLEGSDFNDYFDGDSGDNFIDGRGGDDYITEIEGGSDTIQGGEGEDGIFIRRLSSSADGKADNIYVNGGNHTDSLSFIWHNGDAFTGLMEGGDGDDNLYALSSPGSITTSLATSSMTLIGDDGRDNFYLDHRYKTYVILTDAGNSIFVGNDDFDTHLTSGVSFELVTVSGFSAGDSGDRLMLHNWLRLADSSFDVTTNPFKTGHLQLRQQGVDVVLSYDEGADRIDVKDIFVFENLNVNDLNSYNFFGLDPSGEPATGFEHEMSNAELGSIVDSAFDDDIQGGGDRNIVLFHYGGEDVYTGNATNDTVNIVRDSAFTRQDSSFLLNGKNGGNTFNLDVEDYVTFSGELIGGNSFDTFNVRSEQTTGLGDNADLTIRPGEGINTVNLRHDFQVSVYMDGETSLYFHDGKATPNYVSGIVELVDIHNFNAGANEDVVFIAGLFEDASDWDGTGNLFDYDPYYSKQYARLIQRGADTVLQMSADGLGGYLDTLVFHDVTITELTTADFGGHNPFFSRRDIAGSSAGEELVNSVEADWMYGFEGIDTFYLNTYADLDIIADAEAGEFLKTNWDIFRGLSEFSGSGASEFRYYRDGGHTFVEFDEDGDGNADGEVTILGDWYLVGSDPSAIQISALSPYEDTVRDYGGNGTIDLLFKDDATGAFQRVDDPANAMTPWSQAWANASFVGLADVDGDGITDNIVQAPNGNYAVHSAGSRTGASQITNTGYDILGFADLDGDGADEALARSNASGDTSLFVLNHALATATNIGLGDHLLNGFGDFDNDGVMDAFLTTATGHLALYNSSTGFNQIGHRYKTVVAIGDFDGDGNDDAILHPSGSNNHVLLTYNAGTPLDQLTVIGEKSYTILGTGDFDGDGTMDVLADSATRGFRIWTNGLQTIEEARHSLFEFAAIGDFDGDGEDDLLLTDPRQDGKGRILYSADYTDFQSLGSMRGKTVRDIADYDGDGTDDILVEDNTTGEYSILPGGTGAAIDLDASLNNAELLGALGLDTIGVIDDILPQQMGTSKIKLEEGMDLTSVDLSESLDLDLASEDVPQIGKELIWQKAGGAYQTDAMGISAFDAAINDEPALQLSPIQNDFELM